MTTITQLAKAGKSHFIPAIENIGFRHYGKLIFAREVGDGVHHLIMAELSYGENLKFIITCFVEEYNPEYMDNYPMKIPITSGDDLGEDLLAGELWEVETLDNVEDVFTDVIRNIEMYAMPWFNSVQTRKDYIRVLYPYLKEKLEEQGKLDLVLTGAK